MSDKLILIIIGFVVFFASAYGGRKFNKEDLEKEEKEQKNRWEAKRKQLDAEERALSARKSAQERDLNILKQRLEECQEKLRLTEERLKEAQKSQSNDQSVECNAISVSAEKANNSIRIRNLQADLDLYIQSQYKSTWQIGRDYELFVGQKYIAKGYSVDFYGIRKGFEDKGIDLIAKNKMQILIVQCKYWKRGKAIHENIIHQLYGSKVGYCRENNIPIDKAEPVLVTNVSLTEEAKKVSSVLGVQIIQRLKMEEFPRIKCCIRKNSEGIIQNIYRLPFDESYDSIMPVHPGEHFAWTVQEAEDLGFERK